MAGNKLVAGDRQQLSINHLSPAFLVDRKSLHVSQL